VKRGRAGTGNDQSEQVISPPLITGCRAGRGQQVLPWAVLFGYVL
jgi:hypothetical protein